MTSQLGDCSIILARQSQILRQTRTAEPCFMHPCYQYRDAVLEGLSGFVRDVRTSPGLRPVVQNGVRHKREKLVLDVSFGFDQRRTLQTAVEVRLRIRVEKKVDGNRTRQRDITSYYLTPQARLTRCWSSCLSSSPTTIPVVMAV